MAISKRKDRQGRHVGYQVSVSVPDSRTGKTRRIVLGTYLRRKEADAAERSAKIRIQAGTFTLEPPASIPSVAEAIDAWFQTKRQTVQPNSATGYESAIRLHVLPAFGALLVTELTNDAVQEQVNRWRDEGMGARLLHLCVMILRAALARQVKNGTIVANPALEIEKPSARQRKELVIWNDRQLAAFLDAAKEHRLAPLWAFTLLEGMRRGEALGLRWSDLQWSDDGKACVARISQTVVPDLANGGAALVQNRAKTRSSQRGVQLTGETIRVLKAHRDRQLFERRAAGDVWAENGLIVTTSIGTPFAPSSVKRDLAALIAGAQVPTADTAGFEPLPRVTTHGLRHMAATIMLRAGTSPAIVAAKLGHADIGTTVDRYGHLTVSDQQTANAAIEQTIERARGLA
jgi:integrase